MQREPTHDRTPDANLQDLRKSDEGSVVRLVIFSVLGPPLGFVAVLLRDVALTSVKWPLHDLSIFRFLPFAYLLGFIPAWFTAGADWYLSSKIDGWRRVLGTACAGYILTTLAFLPGLPYGRITFWQFFTAGFIGVLPAAVCSWLSSAVCSWLSGSRSN